MRRVSRALGGLAEKSSGTPGDIAATLKPVALEPGISFSAQIRRARPTP